MSLTSIADHRIYGKFRVLYPDGKFSQPFGFWTARDYADIFGGTVVGRNDVKEIKTLRQIIRAKLSKKC